MPEKELKGWSFPSFSRIHLDPVASAEGVTSVDTGSEEDDAFFDRGPEGTNASPAPADPSPSTPASSTAPAPAPADPNLGGRTPAAAEPAQSWRSVREVAEGLGYKFPDGTANDEDALRRLVQQANTASQSDYYAQLGRQLAPHAPALLKQISTPAPAPAPERSPWEKPEWDKRWAGLVQQDPTTGVYVGKPGVPAEIVAKVNQYAEWVDRRENDPEGYQSYVAERVFEKRFRESFETESARVREQQAIGQIQQANASWLYQFDPTGNVQRGYDGRPVASAAGQRYLYHLEAVAKMGVKDIRHQDALARQAVQAEVYQAQFAQAQAQAQQASNPQVRQSTTAPNANMLGSLPAGDRLNTPAAAALSPTATGMSLMDTLRRDLGGMNDSDFSYE